MLSARNGLVPSQERYWLCRCSCTRTLLSDAVLGVEDPAPHRAVDDRRQRPGQDHHGAQQPAELDRRGEQQRQPDAEEQLGGGGHQGEVEGVLGRDPEPVAGQDAGVVGQAHEGVRAGERAVDVQERDDQRAAGRVQHHAEHHQPRRGAAGAAPAGPGGPVPRAVRRNVDGGRRRTATGAPGGGRRLRGGDSLNSYSSDLACPAASVSACCGLFLPSRAFCSSTWRIWLISLYRGTSGRDSRLPSCFLAAGTTLGEVASTCASS